MLLQDGSRHTEYVEREGGHLTHMFDDARTLYQCFRRGQKHTADGFACGARTTNPDGTSGPYIWTTYDEVRLSLPSPI